MYEGNQVAVCHVHRRQCKYEVAIATLMCYIDVQFLINLCYDFNYRDRQFCDAIAAKDRMIVSGMLIKKCQALEINPT